MNAWVYIAQCADSLYYVGSHRGAEVMGRIRQHNAGLNIRAWTYSRRPVRLVWSTHFQTYTDMIAAERQMKGWSREKKEAVIRGDWDALPELARGRARGADPSTGSG